MDPNLSRTFFLEGFERKNKLKFEIGVMVEAAGIEPASKGCDR